MPDTSCLHIQDLVTGPIRVVDIPWISVRIGRAAYCEVRLTEDDLADEACRLYRRGSTWHIVPVAAKGKVLLDGRPIGASCPLPFDVPFRVGRYYLTLRHDRAAEPSWEIHPAPAPQERRWTAPAFESLHRQIEHVERSATAAASPPPIAAAVAPARQPRETAHTLDAGAEAAAASVKDRWETRWRAAGAEIKARAQHFKARSEPKERPVPAGFDTAPLKEPPVPRAQPGPVPRAQSLSRPIPTPEVTLSQLELTPNDFAESLEAAITAHEIAAQGQPEHIEEPISATPSEPEPRAETTAAALERDEPPLAAEPALFEATGAPAETAVSPTGSSSGRPDELPSRPDPGRRKQASNRGKNALGPRKEPSHQIRMDSESGPTGLDPSEPRSAAKPEKWPSAREILATHCNRPRPQTTPAQTGRKIPTDVHTLARAPAQWSLPAWVAGPPAAAIVMAVGLATCTLSWLWADDSYSASIMTARLLAANRTGQRAPLPESVAAPSGSWTRSTAQHLAHWAIFLSLSEGGKEPSRGEVSTLMKSALAVSPLNPTARLALAQLEQASDARALSSRGLGLSRDAVSLSWCARRLLASGHKQDALRMYTAALNIGIERGPARAALPRYNNDPQAPRYLLPGEECARDIVFELISKRAWTFDEWSAALPSNNIVFVAAARVLREQGLSEANVLLDRVLDFRQPLEAVRAASALTLAARAEAWALKSGWKEAEEHYREAIELCDDETIKRSWWFNLADIEQRLDDEGQRQLALRAAMTFPSGDDIARRAADIQRANITPPYSRVNGTKAN
jgi:tetratricopeptide (TPR) repeat protein